MFSIDLKTDRQSDDLFTASMRRGLERNQSVALLRCNEAQVALITAFRSSALLGLCLIFLLTILYRFSMGFRSGEFTGQSSTVTHGHLNNFWCLWRCGQVPSPAGKWNHHLHKACQQKEAWRALKCPGRWLPLTVDFRKHSGRNTSRWHGSPNHHWLWKLHTGPSNNMDSVPLRSSSRLWDLDFQINAICTFIWKEDFGPLSNSPVRFLRSPGKMFLTIVSGSEVAR